MPPDDDTAHLIDEDVGTISPEEIDRAGQTQSSARRQASAPPSIEIMAGMTVPPTSLMNTSAPSRPRNRSSPPAQVLEHIRHPRRHPRAIAPMTTSARPGINEHVGTIFAREINRTRPSPRFRNTSASAPPSTEIKPVTTSTRRVDKLDAAPSSPEKSINPASPRFRNTSPSEPPHPRGSCPETLRRSR